LKFCFSLQVIKDNRNALCFQATSSPGHQGWNARRAERGRKLRLHARESFALLHLFQPMVTWNQMTTLLAAE